MTVRVFCTLQFEAMHRWPEAKGSVDYLAHPHRHVFHVRCEKTVYHQNRAIEFITLKAQARGIVDAKLKAGGTDTWSCEQWATYLLDMLKLNRCEVSEDNENGAVVEL